MRKIRKQPVNSAQSWRVSFAVILFITVAVVMVWRVFDLQVQRGDDLQSKADKKQQATYPIAASRGSIYDRNGHLLAVSTPVGSIVVDAKLFLDEKLNEKEDRDKFAVLSEALGLSYGTVKNKILSNPKNRYIVFKRAMPPEKAKLVTDKKLKGVFNERQYKRYYPMAEVTSHLVGMTNIDDKGQEGIELAYEHWLQGESGKKKVLRNRLGEVIEELEYLKPAQKGRDLYLSIDKRIQYVAYKELKKAVEKHKAKSGSITVVDVKTGEVLAVVNQPAYNPNNRAGLSTHAIRNRAIIDVFEPGSTMKTFGVAAALESGMYTVNSRINTSPGRMVINGYPIKDVKNYGVLDLGSVLVKSSNIGMSKIVLNMPSENLWSILQKSGFGTATDIGFPGEQSGVLAHYDNWSKAGKAAMSYGYGISTTNLQLAHAYAGLANDGVQVPLTLTKQESPTSQKRIVSSTVAQQIKYMLNDVTSARGTAIKANVPGYKVGGKTGTVKVSQGGGYAEEKYLSIFAGVVPLNNPKYAMVVVINEPNNGDYYGGVVAAPVFSNVMTETLRFMNIVPDDLQGLKAKQKEVAELAIGENNG